MTGRDYPVTVSIAVGDDEIQTIYAEAIDDGGPDGFFTVTEPEAIEHINRRKPFDVAGDEVLLLSRERVVGIEGSVEMLDDLSPTITQYGIDPDDDPGGVRVGGDREDIPDTCPRCAGVVDVSLGGASCRECGWTPAAGESDE